MTRRKKPCMPQRKINVLRNMTSLSGKSGLVLLTLVISMAVATLCGCASDSHFFAYNGYNDVTMKEGTRYYGSWANNKRNGHGVNIWPDGSSYDGEWVNDKRIGHGVYTLSNGERYDGEWVNDRTTHGVKIWPSRERYEGGWVNDKRTGHGVNVWPNGKTYDGEWLNDDPTGYGVLKDVNGMTYQQFYYGGTIFANIPFGPKATSNEIRCKKIPRGWWMIEGRCGANGPEGQVKLIQDDGMSEFSGRFKDGRPADDMTQLYIVRRNSSTYPLLLRGRASAPSAFTQGQMSYAGLRDQKAEWINYYSGELAGYKQDGMGSCLYDVGVWEPCEYRNGQRVDSVYAHRQEMIRQRAAESERIEKEEQAVEARWLEEANSRGKEDHGPGWQKTLLAVGTAAYVGNATQSLSPDQQSKMMESSMKAVLNNNSDEFHQTSKDVMAEREQEHNAKMQEIQEQNEREQAAEKRRAQDKERIRQQNIDEERMRQQEKTKIQAQAKAAQLAKQQADQKEREHKAVEAAKLAKVEQEAHKQEQGQKKAASAAVKSAEKKYKNPGVDATSCVAMSQSGDKVTFTNNCGEQVFVIWCGDLKYSKKKCGDDGRYYGFSTNINAGDQTSTQVYGQIRYAACIGGISFGNDGEYKDYADGRVECLKR